MEDVKKPTKYDPNKNYKWTPTTQFVLNGDEFGATINALRKIMASPEAQAILAAERAHFMLDDALARAVEKDDAIESIPIIPPTPKKEPN